MSTKIDTKKQVTKITYNGAEVPLPNVDTAFEEGKKAEYDRFWDAFQDNGNRTNYEFTFCGKSWTDTNFVPKYDIKPVEQYYLFFSSAISNIKASLESADVTLDTSNCTSLNRTFYGAATSALPPIDASAVSAMDNTFTTCKKLVEVDIVVNESVSYKDTFFACYALENLTIYGTIGQNGLNLQDSTKLSKASITSIINALSTTTSGLSVTLSKTAVEAAFGSTTATEWTTLIGTKSNWTINLV